MVARPVAAPDAAAPAQRPARVMVFCFSPTAREVSMYLDAGYRYESESGERLTTLDAVRDAWRRDGVVVRRMPPISI